MKTSKTSTTAPGTTLILGGNGKTGSRVAQRLIARGLPVRLASRSTSPAFDWENPGTWAGALEGIESIYLTYFPDLAVPSAAEHVRQLTRLAVEHGVRKVVLLGGRGEPQVLPAEQAVRESGLQYTILECAFFFQNFSEGAMAPPPDSGELVFPGGSVAEPFIDADDIADVAVAALTDDAHLGKTYELTGPRLVTFAEVVAEISAATGRELRYVPVSSEAYAEVLAPYLPAETVAFFIELFAFLLDGHNAHVTDGVQRVLGRPARDLRDYVRAAVHAGAWQPAPPAGT